MAIVFNLNKHFNFRNVFSYAILTMLLLFCFCSHIIPSAMGADSKEAPHISLEAKNQSLISVLNKITLDTGFKFKINDQWSTYPVNASFEDMPLGRGLKLILRGLNHSIIYEPGENIKIVVYGKINPSKDDSTPMHSYSPPIREIEEEPDHLNPPIQDEVDAQENVNESSEETEPAGNTEAEGGIAEESEQSASAQHHEGPAAPINMTNEQESDNQGETPEE